MATKTKTAKTAKRTIPILDDGAPDWSVLVPEVREVHVVKFVSLGGGCNVRVVLGHGIPNVGDAIEIVSRSRPRSWFGVVRSVTDRAIVVERSRRGVEVAR